MLVKQKPSESRITSSRTVTMVVPLHRESKKAKKDTNSFLSQFCQILSGFQNTFTITLSKKFTIKLSLNIPPYLKCVVTLPCEILMSDFRLVSPRAGLN